MSTQTNSHGHLNLIREQIEVQVRPNRGFPRKSSTVDSATHAVNLIENLDATKIASESAIHGYDERKLLTIQLTDKIQPEEVRRAVDNVEIVSQEHDRLILAFASTQQLDSFRSRLRDFSNGQHITYKHIILSLSAIDTWTAIDRMGWSLREKGFPNQKTMLLDVTLWPLDKLPEARKMQGSFEQWIKDNDGAIVDAVKQSYLILYRIRCSMQLAEQCLLYRDVRRVDLPPEIGLEQHVVFTGVQDLDAIPEPPRGSPGIAVLDSGVVSGHPVLAPAMGDSQSFLPGRSPSDSNGHGTFVCGIALYDDVAASIQSGKFIPKLRLFSGRVFDENNEGDPKLIENQVEEAVKYFTRRYGCKVFNFSYGDQNRPYTGGHLSGLSVTLDVLSREHGILFVVPTGNRIYDPMRTSDLPSESPEFFTTDEAGLIDPSPALNVLTVGSIARYDKPQTATHTLDVRPAVRSSQPSPFTRHGPSINEAIKPDLIDFGGNLLVDCVTKKAYKGGLGELSVSHKIAQSRAFATDVGTSFSAPRVAHASALALAEIPAASVDLLRALLVAHARIPKPCMELLEGFSNTSLRSIVGYGIVDRTALYRSLDDCVTIWIEDEIKDQTHHLYSIPIPEEFWSLPKRSRELTVSLAYRPSVRSTRIDYREEKIDFKLIQSDSIDHVIRSLSSRQKKEDALRERTSGRSISHRDRSRGTVQVSTWTFRQPSSTVQQQKFYVVVTRRDPTWFQQQGRRRLPYALVTTLSDRDAETSRLYMKVKAELQSRVRARVER